MPRDWEEDGLLREIRDATNADLVAMIRGNYGPGGNAAIETEMMRRLIAALDRSSKASSQAAWLLIFLTVALVVLTVILIVQAST